MKFGIGTGPQNVSWDDLSSLLRTVDELDYDSAWVFDHLLPLSPNADDPVFEGWTTLAALARETTKIDLGVMVSSNTFRHPALLAKMAATVDVISNGRLLFGIGAGYFEPEHEAFGIPLGSVRERADKLAEACQIFKGLWTEPKLTFDGEHYTITDAPCEPKPIRKPHPPILIGGSGEKLTLRTTALYADQWNMPPGDTGVSTEEFEAKLAVLHQRCAEVGRDPSEIETNLALMVVVDEDDAVAKTRRADIASAFGLSEEVALKMILAGDPTSIAADIRRYEAVGVDHFVAIMIHGVNYDDAAMFGRHVIPMFR
jgi:F420-dependent oxidoreductase-like protein